jgi:hypothetical protein
VLTPSQLRNETAASAGSASNAARSFGQVTGVVEGVGDTGPAARIARSRAQARCPRRRRWRAAVRKLLRTRGLGRLGRLRFRLALGTASASLHAAGRRSDGRVRSRVAAIPAGHEPTRVIISQNDVTSGRPTQEHDARISPSFERLVAATARARSGRRSIVCGTAPRRSAWPGRSGRPSVAAPRRSRIVRCSTLRPVHFGARS